MDTRYTADEVTDWLLTKDSMSSKKLRTLLYYTYAWSLVLTNDSDDKMHYKLFNGQFMAWIHGPMLLPIYVKYKKYGYHQIPQHKSSAHPFDDETEDILNQVWKVYGKYNGLELESIVQQESPWIIAREGLKATEVGNSIISDRDIFDYYLSMAE